MTPQQFIAKWQRADLSERSACQQHFLDLCELLGQPKPVDRQLNQDAPKSVTTRDLTSWETFGNHDRG